MRTRSLCALLVLSLAACGDNTSNNRQPDAGRPPDAGPIDIPLERSHAGGSPAAIEVVGTRAFIGIGPRLAIWDLASTPPKLVGESAPLHGVINAIEVVGSRVYVAERADRDSQIHVFDTSTPT